MNAINNKDIFEVIETRRVTKKVLKLGWFWWTINVKADSLYSDIIIRTKRPVRFIDFNSKIFEVK